MKILFQGDSITDAGRDKRNYHDLGNGYPKYAAELIREAHPNLDLEFINLGISGNRTCQLFERLYYDAITLQPDIISILIGINDVWSRYGNNIWTTNEQIAANYRSIMQTLKDKTNAKIIVITPYLLDCDDKEGIRGDLGSVLEIIENLAKEYADVYIPLHKHFEAALETAPEKLYYSGDGIHPNQNGAKFIGEIYAEAIKPLIK